MEVINMAKFQLGYVVATREVHENESLADIMNAIQRHANGDWGELDEHDKKLNDDAVKSGEDRILSKYTLSSGNQVYVITEWDRSVTTVLYPHEY
jgi:hypothetical protein